MSINDPSLISSVLNIEIKAPRLNNQSMREVGLEGVDLLNLMARFEEFGVWRFDLDEGLAYFSQDACILQGMLPASGAMNLVHLSHNYHADDRPLLLHCIEDAISRKSCFQFVLRTLNADGQNKTRVVEVAGQFRNNGKGKPELFGTIRQVRTRVRSVILQD
ncbi:hypothetical protein [Zhengella mangrovi]|uniref:hypothetical protein n=1 Tax=Zhengella mangrovi TaxID=1982044 RepID=UPI0010563806|nr:hypothetical protein [Zhengella mangrovi]